MYAYSTESPSPSNFASTSVTSTSITFQWTPLSHQEAYRFVIYACGISSSVMTQLWYVRNLIFQVTNN